MALDVAFLYFRILQVHAWDLRMNSRRQFLHLQLRRRMVMHSRICAGSCTNAWVSSRRLLRADGTCDA